MSNPDAGTLAGRFEDQGDFQVFVPYSLPPVVNYNSIMDLVTEAHRCIGDLGRFRKSHAKLMSAYKKEPNSKTKERILAVFVL